jgi:outer membrane cobalamin receptor
MSWRLSQAEGFLLACTLFLSVPCFLFSQNEDSWADEVPIIEDEGITVTGSSQTTQQMDVVTREEIASRNNQDIVSLLQEALDLGLTRYGPYGNQSSINLRGFDSSRIAFLINGVPVNSLLGGDFELSQINPASIDRIEVIHGGSDTKYNVSGALGGVINIITVRKETPGLKIGGSVSNMAALPGNYRKENNDVGDPHWEDILDAQNFSLSGSYGAENYSVTANAFANRAANHFLYRDDIFNKTRRKEGNEVWDTGSRLSFVRDLPEYAKLIASADVYYSDKNIPRSGFSSALVGKQNDFTTRQNLMLDMPRAFHDNFSTEATIAHNWQRMDYKPPSGDSSLHDEHSISVINRWSWYSTEKLTLRTGGDYQYTFLDSIDTGLQDRHDGGLYLTAEIQAHKKFLIIPHIKGVFSGPNAGMPAVPVPKLGLLWNVTDSLSLKNNYFRSFKHPNFQDLYWGGGEFSGNSDLKPEDGWGGDIGVEWRYGDWVNIGSAFFTQWTRDSIHWAAYSGTLWRPENVGEAMYFGLDSKIQGEIPLASGPLRTIGLSLSYQYLLSYLLSNGYTWSSEKRIPYMPMHTIGASLDFSWGAKDSPKAGSLSISGHYEDIRFANTSNITKLDPYFLLNANVNQQLGKSLTAFITARNILNISYESMAEYPMPGITITLGMRFNIEPKQEESHE